MREQSLNSLSLSRQIHIPQPTLHHILSGVTKKPSSKVIKALTEFFNVSASSLIDCKLHMYDLISLKKVPIYTWDEISHCFKESRCSEQFIFGNYADKSFAFSINKGTCQSSWPDKSLAIIEKGQLPEEGRMGLAWLKEHGLILSKVYKDKGSFFIKQPMSKEQITLLKFNSVQDVWYGLLSELRLEEQEAIDDYLHS
ncbi:MULTISPECIES: hypothetical protein [Legionella]